MNGDVPDFRLQTERLEIRLLSTRDVDAFVRYRNIADVARYQDWDLPYTEEMAHALVAGCHRLGRPTPGEWLQLAIDRDGVLVGDLAVWIDHLGELAMIGYTVDPDHQGHNYAVEAAGVMVDWLFEHAGVHRISATLDPRNMPSARVLERCGFEYVGTARSSAFVRDEWTDDARFSLLRPDRERWKQRPTDPPASIEFVEITADNIRDVGRIEVAHSQRRFVAAVTQSIADAAHPPVDDGIAILPWYRAIEADGELAGFVMVAMPTANEPIPYLWRMLVDTWQQRRGIARRAIGELARMLIDLGHQQIEVSFVDEPDGPERFYAQLGFERTGDVDDGEVVARADLAEIVRRLSHA